MMPNAQPKPRTRKQDKARKDRQETKRERIVRAQCVERDGYCRVFWLLGIECEGESQWAHMHAARRSKTRGLPPEVRHSTLTSLMLCAHHHDRYDGRARPRIGIGALTSAGADGLLMVGFGTAFHLEKQITRCAL